MKYNHIITLYFEKHYNDYILFRWFFFLPQISGTFCLVGIVISKLLPFSMNLPVVPSRLVTVEFRWAQLRCSYPPRPFEAGSLPAGALCYDNSSATDLDTRSHSKEIDVEMMRQREGIAVYVVTFVEHKKVHNIVLIA